MPSTLVDILDTYMVRLPGISVKQGASVGLSKRADSFINGQPGVILNNYCCEY